MAEQEKDGGSVSKLIKLSDEAVKQFIKYAKDHFTEYVNQREEDIDERYVLSDWMYKSGHNQTVYDREKRAFVPRYKAGKAKMGSILFHRQVNTLAGILGSILISNRKLIKYADKAVNGNPLAMETGSATADHMTALADWVQKTDDLGAKLPEFCTSIFKDSNIFAMVGMKRERRTVWNNEPVAEATGEIDANGVPIFKYKSRLRSKTAYDVYPTVTFPYPPNVYADKYIAKMKDQEVVLLLSQTTKTRLMAEGKYLDQEKVRLIEPSKFAWDGTFGKQVKTDSASNSDRSEVSPTTTSGILLRWDVYAWCPVNGTEWDDGTGVEEDSEKDVEHKLFWGTFVGNDLSENEGECLCLKMVDDFAPDGEIPIKEIRASADNSDMLYHTFFSEVVRSHYAADCALLGAALDNNALRNDPPMSIIDGLHSIKDLTYKSGQRWHVQSHEAIKEFPIQDNTMQTVNLREQVRGEVKMALATDDAKLGEYAGARTSATEIMKVAGSTDTTIAIRNAYIIQQLLPWLGKKYLSYIRAYMEPAQIKRILNEDFNYGIQDDVVLGEYDVVVDVVGEYEDDTRRDATMLQMMQLMLSNPSLLQSESHKVDMMELLTVVFDQNRWPSSRILKPATPGDSESLARLRVNAMLMGGQYVPPGEGENYQVHLRVAEAERLRWNGLEDVQDPRAVNLPLLDQYIAEVKQRLTNQGQQAGGSPAGIPPAPMTPGQANAAPQAASLGAAMGGIA